MIGKLGDIPFEVSFDGKNKKILNFSNLKLNSGANYGKHTQKGQKPALEFIDLKSDILTFKMTFRSDFGIDPQELLKKLNEYKNNGETLDFSLGNNPVGSGQYVITSYDAGYEYITNGGKIRKIDISLTLEEYLEMIYKNIDIVVKPKKATKKKSVSQGFNQGMIDRGEG
ncbi:phage tail protein [Psychrilyobacter atlanticus]|uniref:phage tail protein n=1 Tax=Psychrilyobacter atlanticus TaxID=271091 RepID=UPI000415DEE2|nr:phage tail protein [Psychrilyobacter atlanticus]